MDTACHAESRDAGEGGMNTDFSNAGAVRCEHTHPEDETGMAR
jgi:hypothetical protein